MKNQSIQPDFSSLTLSTVIYSAIQKAGYKHPTDVQLETIPTVLEGKDVLARAETGSGKTAAFVLPLLEKIVRQRSKQFRKQKGNIVDFVVLVPTRELAIQIREEFDKFSIDFTDKVKCLSVYGGVKINPQMIGLRGGADVLVSTPGRLLDLSRNNAILLNQVKTLVVDEVDRLMKGDFEEEINEIFKLMPNKRQNLMFTATFPGSIRKLVRQIMNEPTIINVDDLYDDITINQRVITVNYDKKNDLLAHLLKSNDWKQILVFCSVKRSCDNLVKKLEKRDVEAVAMHGNLQQNARARALSDFKSGKTRVLIATDVAARGIDIEQLPCVINYELPRSPNDYTHRIGRTGRAGEEGTAISLISHQEYQHFGVIEKRNGIRLKREQIEGFEADTKAPEAPKRSKPKKKAKSKKRKSLVEKKKVTNKLKRSAETDKAKEAAKERKKHFAERAKAEQKKPMGSEGKQSDVSPSKYPGKPHSTQVTSSNPSNPLARKNAKSKSITFDDQPSKPSGASLYTRKLPKSGD